MEFGNPVVGGVQLVRTDIESKGFVSGSNGWRISRNGNAEFNDVTIRGNVALNDFYAPVTSVYDSSAGGAPSWTPSSFTLFSSNAWSPVDVVVPASGRIRYDIKIRGINSNTAASILGVDLESLISSGGLFPGTDHWIGPGITDHTPNAGDEVCNASQVAGSTSAYSSSTYLILDGLTPNTWYRLRPYWRISSGSAATVTFFDLDSRFTVTPII